MCYFLEMVKYVQDQSAPAAAGSDESFMRQPAAAVVAGISSEEVFVPTIPKNDDTMAMLENSVKGTLLLLYCHLHMVCLCPTRS
jgi:hypothetical protein